MRPIFSKRFDIAGMEVLRVARLSLLGKYVPLGSLRGGPGGRCLLVLLAAHATGRMLFSLAVRQEQRLHRLYQWLRR